MASSEVINMKPKVLYNIPKGCWHKVALSIDVNILCLNSYDDVFKVILEKGKKYRNSTKGYGIGSGNSIAGYVPEEGFQGMIDAVNEIRKVR